MEKINFVNGEAPYLSATNLNQMQDNVENAINDVNVNILKTAIISGEVSGSTHKVYTPNYSSIGGNIVASILLGVADTVNNINITQCVPHHSDNIITSVTISTTTTSDTHINILVLYK